MGTTVATGTLIVYGTSSIFAIFDNFKLSFYLAGITVIIVAVIWMLFYNKSVNDTVKEKDTEEIELKSNNEVATEKQDDYSQKKILKH